MIRQTLAAVLVAATVGAGCTFSPVYSSRNDMSLAFDFGSPTTRLEQVVYNELSLRFASSEAPNTPDLIVTANAAHEGRFSSSAPTVTLQDASRATVGSAALDQYHVTVTATARAVLNGEELFSVIRAATAEYRAGHQVLSNETARIEAEERAAKAAAESLRLALLAEFPKHASYLRPQP